MRALESPDGTPWQPTLRLRSELAVEPLQTVLFVPTRPTCRHVSTEWQLRLSAPAVAVCVACGREVDR